MEENNLTPLATEIYEDLKRANKFKEKLIYILMAVIAVLVIALAATNIYHIYMWSQFDTVIIDGSEGVNAIYSQGDNTGGIYNGESGDKGPEEGKWEIQGSQG